MLKFVDRLQYATELSRDKRVLDIGGQKMPSCDPKSPFARSYATLANVASEYRIVDVQDKPEVDYVLDLNRRESLEGLKNALEEYRPETILCMETLEHINYHFEVMNIMAQSIAQNDSEVFVTIPNNGNWLINILPGWNVDHSVAFLRGIADRFVSRSDLGKYNITRHRCMQTYVWYWPVVYAMSFFQPFSWGFTVRKVKTEPSS